MYTVYVLQNHKINFNHNVFFFLNFAILKKCVSLHCLQQFYAFRILLKYGNLQRKSQEKTYVFHDFFFVFAFFCISIIYILPNFRFRGQKKRTFFLDFFFANYRTSARYGMHKTAEDNAKIHIFLKTAKFFRKKCKKKLLQIAILREFFL